MKDLSHDTMPGIRVHKTAAEMVQMKSIYRNMWDSEDYRFTSDDLMYKTD